MPHSDPLRSLVRAHLVDTRTALAREDGERRAVLALQRVHSARTSARWPRRMAGLLAVAAVCAGLFLVLRTRRAPSSLRPTTAWVTYEVQGARDDNGYVHVPSSAPPAALRFSDGTRVALAAGSASRVSPRGPHAAEIALEMGTLRCDVEHHADTQWTVRAGPYAVKVQGTSFDVTWSPAERTLRVSLERGAVTVEGPSAGDGVRMQPGQRLLANARDGQITLESRDVIARAAPAVVEVAQVVQVDAGTEPEPVRPEETPEETQPVPRPHRVRTAPVVVPSWSQRTAAGEGDAVLREANAQGIDSALSTRDADDLAALGDAARYAHNAALAQRAYLALRARFASDPHAHDAAFFLGRVLEDARADEASGWYQRYLDASPAGPFAPEALGRLMLIAQRSGDASRTQALAREYLARFPEGSFTRAALALRGAP